MYFRYEILRRMPLGLRPLLKVNSGVVKPHANPVYVECRRTRPALLL